MEQTAKLLADAPERNTAAALMARLQTRAPKGHPSYLTPNSQWLQKDSSADALERNTAAVLMEALPLEKRVEFLIR
jgi:hypothetical protein